VIEPHWSSSEPPPPSCSMRRGSSSSCTGSETSGIHDAATVESTTSRVRADTRAALVIEHLSYARNMMLSPEFKVI